jgi:hypothetical protein
MCLIHFCRTTPQNLKIPISGLHRIFACSCNAIGRHDPGPQCQRLALRADTGAAQIRMSPIASAECLPELLALSHVSPPLLSKSSKPPISFLCIYAQVLVPRPSPTPRLHRNLSHNLFHFWKFLFEIFNSKSYYHVITNIFHRPSASRGRFRVLPSFAPPDVLLPPPPRTGLSSSSMQQTKRTST